MAGATLPQPALPHDDDLGWLIAAYAAQLAEVRQEMAEARREIIAAKAGRGDVNALTLLELRMADRNGILLDFERKLDELQKASATLRTRDEMMEMRRAMLDPAPVRARPVRRRRKPGRHAEGQGELFAIDGAKGAPALLPLAGLGAWSRHAAAVKLTAGGVAAGFAVAGVAVTASHRADLETPWSHAAQPQPSAVLAPALSVPLDPDAPLLARTFPASYPGKHHKPATVTLTAPSLTVPVPAAPAPAPSQAPDTSQPSGSSQPSDWSQSPDSSQQDQWSQQGQQDQQDQQGGNGHGGNWQQDNQQSVSWQNDQGQGRQQYQGRHRGNSGQQDQDSQGGNGSQDQQGNGNGHGNGGGGGPGGQGNGNGNGNGNGRGH